MVSRPRGGASGFAVAAGTASPGWRGKRTVTVVPGLRKYHEKLGAVRYSVFVLLLLCMMALPIKMVLRWLFNLKYIVAMPEIFFNI